jgi:uncharacterized protein (TIGR02996 family)
MSDEAGFLISIADQPAERSTRLVYADWLDDHDRPREAEFLRLQLQVAGMNTRLIELGGELDAKWLTAVGVVTNRAYITLRTGRDIRLQSLRQYSFYAGLLEGLPTREMNQREIESLVRDEQSRRGEAPYLVEPPERPIEYKRDSPYPFGTPAHIPGIACIGQFDSFKPARDESHDGSCLTIIWFQDDYAFPIDPGVYEHIRAIDWEKHAHDFYW